MPLTRSFKELVQARVKRDPEFRRTLLEEGIEAFLAGDIDTSKTILRDYINASIGFDALSEETGTPAKSLMRMFGPNGNPSARNLSTILGVLRRHAGMGS